MGELYGEVNKMTLEWQDGLMALTVRQCVQVKGQSIFAQ
jgi:dynein heavy chain